QRWRRPEGSFSLDPGLARGLYSLDWRRAVRSTHGAPHASNHKASKQRGQMSRLRTLAATLAALGLSLANVFTASAEAYPTRPIKIIIPTPAGGPGPPHWQLSGLVPRPSGGDRQSAWRRQHNRLQGSGAGRT